MRIINLFFFSAKGALLSRLNGILSKCIQSILINPDTERHSSMCCPGNPLNI